MRYQETWIKGQSVNAEYQRPCEERYPPIKEFLSQYNRGFSVFDLGANLGYFSLRIAEDYPESVAIMADSRPDLLEVLKQNQLPNTIWINGRISALGLDELSKAESFDVVLALSVLHHFGQDWKAAFTAIRKLGDWVIAEIPAVEDTGSLNGYLGAEMKGHIESIEGIRLIGEFKSHKSGKIRPMYLVPGLSNAITRQTVDSHARGAPPLKGVQIASDFDSKTIHIEHGDVTQNIESRNFIHGMNLWNFLIMGGAWPNNTKALVANEIERMGEDGQWHDDLRPWNFILTGDKTEAIDTQNKAWRKDPEPHGLNICLEMMDRRK